MIPQVSLVLHDGDSLILLRRALENAVTLHAGRVTLADAQATSWAAANQPAEAARNARRSIELERRRALLQQLVDQLPTDTSALPEAPMGER